MARLFVDTSSQLLRREAAAVSGPPFTVALWAYIDDATINSIVLCLGDKDASNDRWLLNFQGDLAGDPLRLNRSSGGGAADIIATANGFTANVWSHAFFRAASVNDVQIVLNGDVANSASSAVNKTPIAWDRTSFGSRDDGTPGLYTSGRLAELAVWSAALTTDDGIALNAGFSPLQIVPESGVSYVPVYGLNDPEEDWYGAHDFALVNGPIAQAEHAPNLSVGGWSVVGLEPAAAGIFIPPDKLGGKTGGGKHGGKQL